MEQTACKEPLTTAEVIARMADDPDRRANLELASRVTCNDRRAVKYYWAQIAARIQDYVQRNIMHRDITGEYYQFLSEPFDPAAESPRWRRVSLYKAFHNSTLYTYTNRISIRQYCKIAKREKKMENSESELLEYIDYEALLLCDRVDEPEADPLLGEAWKRVQQAFATLKERDQVVLQCLVMGDMHWQEAFDELRGYLNPSGPDDAWKDWTPEEKQRGIDQHWTPEDKQTAMSGLRARAIEHLKSRVEKLKEKEAKQLKERK